MLKLQKTTIRIPFCGFYESEASYMINNEIEKSFDHEGSGEGEIPEDFYDHWGKANKAVEIAFSKAYVECFQDWLKNEHDLDISLEFKDLWSPQFYNFETDQITCEINQEDVLKLWNAVDTSELAEVIKARHSHRSDFASFYSNEMNANEWSKSIHDWDEIQLETLLIAVLMTKDVENMDYCAMLEDMSCNGHLNNIVWNNCSPECLEMVNEYDEKARA